MSDDLSSKIEQLRDLVNSGKLDSMKDMLSGSKLDSLRGMMNLMSNGPQQSTQPEQSEQPQQNTQQQIPFMGYQQNQFTPANQQNNGSFDVDTVISKVKRIMESSKQINDPRINLLNALKPYLNPKRQQRIDGCNRILNLTILSKVLKDENL